MQRADFLEILDTLRDRGSELDDIEAKQASGGTPTRLWQSLSALANRVGGGVLIFGLTPENFQPSGIKNVDEVQREVANLASQEMEPPIRGTFNHFTVDKKPVLVFSVPECDRRHKPCYYKPRGLPTGAYIRVGDSDRQMTDYEVQRLIAERGQPEEDIRPLSKENWDGLDHDRVKEFFEALRKKKKGGKHLDAPDDVLVRRYRIAAPSTNTDRAPTLAGYLMFGNYPQAEFPNLCITVVRYVGAMRDPGAEATEMLDNQKLEGPIPDMVEEAMAVIRRNMSRRTLKKGLLSEELSEYPEIAVREVLVNAVGHRDYSPGALGTQVQAKIFSDGLVIQSPGGLFGPVTEENLDEVGIQATRNVHLVRLFEEIGLAENRGSGIRTVISLLSQARLPPPSFEDGRTFFRVVFSNQTLLDEDTIQWLNQFANVPLNDRQRLALAYLRKRRNMQNVDYRRLNQCDSRVATADLAELRDLKLIVQRGKRRWTAYALSPALEDLALPANWKPRHRMVFAFIRNEGTASIRDIAEGCEMSGAYARLTVRELVRMKALEPVEKKKRSPKQAYRIRTGISKT